MVGAAVAALVAVAVAASLFMVWALGANSNSPPFAPAIGANAISTRRAALLVGLLATAGAITQGGNISETVGSRLVEGVAVTPLAAAVGLLTAAGYVILGVDTGYPVPAAFATTAARWGATSIAGRAVRQAVPHEILVSSAKTLLTHPVVTESRDSHPIGSTGTDTVRVRTVVEGAAKGGVEERVTRLCQLMNLIILSEY